MPGKQQILIILKALLVYDRALVKRFGIQGVIQIGLKTASVSKPT